MTRRSMAWSVLGWFFFFYSQITQEWTPQEYPTRKACEAARAVVTTKLFPGDLISEECVRLDFEVVGAAE
jgi:hypothetical protein